MAGLIARLFGGKTATTEGPAEPAPGVGGYTAGTGPAGQTGFPGSTGQRRTFPGRNPTNAPGRYGVSQGNWTTVKAQTNYGFDQSLAPVPMIRQESYRGDVIGGRTRNPRETRRVVTPQTEMRYRLQNNSTAEFFGGPRLRTGEGNNTAGGETLRGAWTQGGHSAIDTTTPLSRANVELAQGVPGAQNVRNDWATDYKYPAGILHTYKSAPRPDQAPVNPGGQATDGNVHQDAVTQDVTVTTRAQFPELGWSVLREMPYGGRGNGARGADLNGQRYYAAGQSDQFWNAGQGEYGVARLRGGDVKRPVSFTQPAPWTAQFYDTTADVGTLDDPNASPGQQPQAVYYSPGGMRASNSTGRTG
jgi:hypothetical protein